MTDPVVINALNDVKNKLVVVRTGTSASGTTGSANTLTVTLDNDPSNTPVSAISAAGLVPKGIRVLMLAYPTRGLVVIGRLDGNAAYNQINTNKVVTGVITGTSLTISGAIAGGSAAITGAVTGGSFASANMRAKSQRDTTSRTGFIAGSYTNLAGVSITGMACPPSGILVITMTALATPTAASTANKFFYSVQVDNVTQGTTPHAPSDNNAASTSALIANGQVGIARTILVASAGNTGDSLTIQPMYRVNGGTWGVDNMWLTVEPSL